MKLREFGSAKEFPIDKIKDFKKFIEEAWNKRYSLYDDSDLYYTNENNKQQFLIFDENLIKGKNYVGFICYENTSITVYPKIFDKNIEKEALDLDKYLIMNLLYWLKRSKRIRIPIIDTSIELNEENNFLEILIYIFSKHTYDLIYNKPFNCYEQVEEELTYLKGSLNINKYLKDNISTGKWTKFNAIYEPFIYNNKFNQIIKFVASKLLNISKNKDSINYLRKISFILDEVDNIYCTTNSCDEIKLNRLQEDYSLILSFCDMFLKNTSLSNFDKEGCLNFCFLLPMELLFEDFIFNFIKENFSNEYKEITAQKSNLYLAEVIVNNDLSSKVFNLKQDIYLKDFNNKITILDTKYKVLNENENYKYGISQSDMYQMCSYALKGGYTNLILIYPKTKNFNKDIKFIVKNGFNNEMIEIKVNLVSFYIEYTDYLKTNSINNLYSTYDFKILNTILY